MNLPTYPPASGPPATFIRVESASRCYCTAQSSWLSFFIQNAIRSSSQRFCDKQPHAIGTDIDCRQTTGQFSRQIELFIFHRHACSPSACRLSHAPSTQMPSLVCSQENQRDKTTSRGSKVYAEENEPNAFGLFEQCWSNRFALCCDCIPYLERVFFRSGIPTRLRAAESICLKFDLRHFFLLHT